MKRNEQTSPRVSRIAAKVLAMSRTQLMRWASQEPGPAEIRALAASALTQAADKPSRKLVGPVDVDGHEIVRGNVIQDRGTVALKPKHAKARRP